MSTRLRVDWPSCRGRGLCFDDLLGLAREAARTCPMLALRLVVTH